MKLAREITPEPLRCVIGACPSVYETDTEYVVVGRRVDSNGEAIILGIKVGAEEVAAAIPKNYLSVIAER